MSPTSPPQDPRRSLEATLRFALGSGAWILPTSPRPEVRPAPAAAAVRQEEAPGLSAALQAVRDDLGDCRRCRLSAGRTQLVFGVGHPRAPIVFVGEAPGAEEDRRGEPFVGRAGQLLDRMIRAIGFERGQVYIANVLKCRPPENRDPAEDEKAACLPVLWRQIEAVGPRVVCALGGHAAKALLGTDAPIGSLRGKPTAVRGFTVVPTYHPAFLLRNPLAKRQAWEDLKRVRALALAAPGAPEP